MGAKRVIHRHARNPERSGRRHADTASGGSRHGPCPCGDADSCAAGRQPGTERYDRAGEARRA